MAWRFFTSDGRVLGQGRAGVGVPTGGATGEVLTKDSGLDFDTSWQAGGGGAAAAGTLTGNTLAAGVIHSSLQDVGTLSALTVTAPIVGSVTGSSGSTSGLAATATALATPRNINGVAFDGTANITVTAAAGTLSGATLAAGVTASSLTSVGTLATLTVTAAIVGSVTGSSGSTTGNAATATALATARAINGVNFDGTAAITVTAAAGTLSGATLAAGVTASSLTSVGTLATLTVTAAIVGSVTGSSGSTTGNAATATALATARNINGVAFDGTGNITVVDSAALPKAGGTMTGEITSTLGTITTDIRVHSGTATWNAAGVTFFGYFQNITNTASAAASRLIDLRVANASKLNLTVAGLLTTIEVNCGTVRSAIVQDAEGGTIGWAPSGIGGAGFTGIGLGNTRGIRFSPDGVWYTAPDAGIKRNAAGVVEINSGTAGTFRDLKLRDIFINGATYLARTSAALTDSAAAQIATLTNAPVAGNPTKWIAIDDNGTSRKIPCW